MKRQGEQLRKIKVELVPVEIIDAISLLASVILV